LSRKKCKDPLSSGGSRREKPISYARNNRLYSGAVSVTLSFRGLTFLQANPVTAPVGVDPAEIFPGSLQQWFHAPPCCPPFTLTCGGERFRPRSELIGGALLVFSLLRCPLRDFVRVEEGRDSPRSRVER